MHDTAIYYGKRFFDVYAAPFSDLTIVDIGAQDVNGSLRSVAPSQHRYIGVDCAPGKGVDVVIDDPYVLPFESESIDVCVSSSCFEHADFFWLLFNEILRVLKPTGVFYLSAPSGGMFHRYPVDAWRFYPDSGLALQKWGRRNQYPVALLESFIGMQGDCMWNDFVAVFLKDEAQIDRYPNRIQDVDNNVFNALVYPGETYRNHLQFFPDQLAHMRLKEIVASINTILER